MSFHVYIPKLGNQPNLGTQLLGDESTPKVYKPVIWSPPVVEFPLISVGSLGPYMNWSKFSHLKFRDNEIYIYILISVVSNSMVQMTEHTQPVLTSLANSVPWLKKLMHKLICFVFCMHLLVTSNCFCWHNRFLPYKHMFVQTYLWRINPPF